MGKILAPYFQSFQRDQLSIINLRGTIILAGEIHNKYSSFWRRRRWRRSDATNMNGSTEAWNLYIYQHLGKSLLILRDQFPNLTLLALGTRKVILGGGGYKLSCVLQNIQQHLWPLPLRCQQHTHSWQLQMSKDIINCPLRVLNHFWLRTSAIEQLKNKIIFMIKGIYVTQTVLDLQ